MLDLSYFYQKLCFYYQLTESIITEKGAGLEHMVMRAPHALCLDGSLDVNPFV